MTKMLASVTSVAEAELALALGADIIDLKNPKDGALGALPLATIRDIVRFVDHRRMTSATIGDVPEAPAEIIEKISATAATGVDIVKIGIATSRCTLTSWRGMAGNPYSARLVAVLLVEDRFDLEWIDGLAALGFYGVMLDTEDKRSGGLRSRCDEKFLTQFLRRANARNLVCGLAGSLAVDDIASLLTLAPDYLGFRGALCCDSERTAQLSTERFRAVRACIPIETQCAAINPMIASTSLQIVRDQMQK